MEQSLMLLVLGSIRWLLIGIQTITWIHCEWLKILEVPYDCCVHCGLVALAGKLLFSEVGLLNPLQRREWHLVWEMLVGGIRKEVFESCLELVCCPVPWELSAPACYKSSLRLNVWIQYKTYHWFTYILILYSSGNRSVKTVGNCSPNAGLISGIWRGEGLSSCALCFVSFHRRSGCQVLAFDFGGAPYSPRFNLLLCSGWSILQLWPNDRHYMYILKGIHQMKRRKTNCPISRNVSSGRTERSLMWTQTCHEVSNRSPIPFLDTCIIYSHQSTPHMASDNSKIAHYDVLFQTPQISTFHYRFLIYQACHYWV